MAPLPVSQEEEKIRSDYKRLFGEYCPLHCVGFARIYEAIRTNTPVPESEYELRECDEEEIPNHCWAETSEEEQAVLEYERVFNEECPVSYVTCERLKQAIAENKPIPPSEYAGKMHIV